MAQPMPTETDALLTRLSQKPGVQSTLVLSRATGAIVRTTGLISTSTSPNPNSTLPSSSTSAGANPTSPATPSKIRDGTDAPPQTPGTNGVEVRADGVPAGMTSAEELAGKVWAFVNAAGGLAVGLNGEESRRRDLEREGGFGGVAAEAGLDADGSGDGAGAAAKGADEVKLLRLRTRRNEIVIVPDAKFLLVVIHDTPPA
ncbi:MAG: hypothetical protein M4579_004323 [Chaenotheca gracillima]|nr:MAG: hypothetical protein M4579_004323 [Chaenotheca gracillima]